MPKGDKSRQLDYLGLEVIADEFTGTFNGTNVKAQITALTNVTTPDATDPATVITLANANKAKINQIIAALKA